jgi:hypothetical protein
MAFGPATLNDAAGAASDLFGGIGDLEKAKGARFEQQRYDEAALFAGQEEKYVEESEAIKQAQLDRQAFLSQSQTRADVAGAGLAISGSGLDILADSASQAALTKQVAARQGFITEEGYQQQQKSYQLMSEAAGEAANADKLAAFGSFATGAIKGAAAVATLL